MNVWKCVAALSLIFLSTVAHAADFYCASGNAACLVAAIESANANAETNDIHLAAGIYTLTVSDRSDTDGPNGLPSIIGNVRIHGNGSTIERSLAASEFRLFHVASSGQLVLDSLELENGVVGGNSRAEYGGAIFNRGFIQIVNSVIHDNSKASPAIGSGGGGAIFNGSTGVLELRNSQLRGNHAASAQGGAIYSAGNLTITDSVILENRAEEGGGVFVARGSAIFMRTTLHHNSGTVRGGGLYNAGQAVIEKSTIDSNTNEGGPQAGGGGVFNSGDLSVVYSTVSRNLSRGIGGAILNEGGTTRLKNVSVLKNASEKPASQSDPDPGGGIYKGGGTVELQATILALNRSLRASTDCSGVVSSLGGNVIGTLGEPVFAGSQPSCGIVLASTDTVGDPHVIGIFGEAAPGQGHYLLLPDSPALGAGSSGSCPSTDQLERPGVGACDSGAIEFQGLADIPIPVNNVVIFQPVISTYRTIPSVGACPAGTVSRFQFSAALLYPSGPPLSHVVTTVNALTNGNVLEINDGPAGCQTCSATAARGATIVVEASGSFNDGKLGPGEAIEVPYSVCLTSTSPFTFLVDVKATR